VALKSIAGQGPLIYEVYKSHPTKHRIR